MTKIYVITKRPGEAPRHVWMSNTLAALQKAVDGYIETVSLPNGIVIICNEEGRLRNMPFNFRMMIGDIVGPVVICGRNGDEFGDLPYSFDDMKKLMPQLWIDQEAADE